ncbi:hypothetical protein K3179_07860 [Qipengyuania sp. GH38]|uniref:hypothetical protein n=1 Tax=Qipengyuania intermedia TaxID=2867244 RepID=UPI001C88A607|nr:hypothetical protein [Qipengyuania intermedia]MBX7514457.1 hypothetical protein [Qipengyuania intermedia]
MRKKTICLVGQQKGGSGKTTFTDILNATCEAGGNETLVVDVDDGNSGYIRRCGQGSALSLSWAQPAGGASTWIDSHLTGKDVVLFDLGANLFASGTAVTQFLAEVFSDLRASGARIIFFAVASTNSPGTGRLIMDMRNDFGSLGEVRIVETNIDGSGAFPREIHTLGLPRVQVAHIDPGIQAARLLKELPLLEALENPPAGYELAMALYAQRLVEFAKQETVSDIAGTEGVARIQRLARNAPSENAIVPCLAKADNSSIQSKCAFMTAFFELCEINQSDHEAVYRAAIAMLAARERHLT